MKPIELYDILTLEDDKDYTIANMVQHNDSSYLYLIEVDENEEVVADNQLIVKRVIKDGDEAVEKVTDENEYKEVARVFFDLFKEKALEENKSDDSNGNVGANEN